jgi:hypothetical protein
MKPGDSSSVPALQLGDDQLRAALEEVGEAQPTVRAVEVVVLHDLDHGQFPALGVERVALPGQVLLLGEQLLASGKPLLARGDPGKAHHGPLTLR